MTETPYRPNTRYRGRARKGHSQVSIIRADRTEEKPLSVIQPIPGSKALVGDVVATLVNDIRTEIQANLEVQKRIAQSLDELRKDQVNIARSVEDLVARSRNGAAAQESLASRSQRLTGFDWGRTADLVALRFQSREELRLCLGALAKSEIEHQIVGVNAVVVPRQSLGRFNFEGTYEQLAVLRRSELPSPLQVPTRPSAEEVERGMLDDIGGLPHGGGDK